MKDIVRYTKLVYESFREDKGKLKLDPYSRLARMQLDEDSIDFLRNYLYFVLTSGILSEAAMIWFNSIEDSHMRAVRDYSNSVDNELKKITPKQASNSFDYDARKLNKYFPLDMLNKIFTRKGDIKAYTVMLEAAYDDKLKKSIFDSLLIFKVPYAINTEQPKMEDIENILRLIKPYTKSEHKQVMNQLDPKVIGYINYIANKSNRTDEEQHIIDQLKALK